MYKCVVVVPVYKAVPKKSELASFKQVLTVLRNYDITVFTYQGLNLSVYEKTSCDIKKNFSVEFFDKHYFESVSGYNSLCYKTDFYHRFSSYDYMLIYQLDAWVFRDELQYWCDKGYDYIGAPLFWSYSENNYTTKISSVGNGGFTLRRVSYCINILSMPKFRPYLKPMRILKVYYNYCIYSDKYKKWRNRIKVIPFCFLKFIGVYNNLNYYINKRQVNEDIVFGSNAKYAWGVKANIPSFKDAACFSFEVHPEFLYHSLGDRLPFGCHAFEKWDYDSFWRDYIRF